MTSAFIYISVVFVWKNRENKEQKKKNSPLCRVFNPKHSAKGPAQVSILCRVLKQRHSAKIWKFAECQRPALGKIDTWPHPVAGTLPSAKVQHSAKWTRGGNLSRGLCRVSDADPRQKFKLCRVPAIRHSAKRLTRVAPHSCFAECQGTRQKVFAECP